MDKGKVWVIMDSVHFDGDFLAHVCGTPERAQVLLEEAFKITPGAKWVNETKFIYPEGVASIEEHEVE